jgi:hypothetical protein
MIDAAPSQDMGTSESARMQALERFYVIRPFLEDGVPGLGLPENEPFPDGP